MKNAFVPFELHRQEDGTLFTDADGCSYLRPHSHPLLKGKEFCHQGEVVTLIRDNNILAAQIDELTGKAKATPFRGEFVLLNVVTF
jgi:hypothetical protein